MSLKYRHKKFASLYSHDRGNWRLFKETNASLSRRAVTQLNFVNHQITNIFNTYKQFYNNYFFWLTNLYFSSKYLFLLLNLLIIKTNFTQNTIWFYNKSNISNMISTFSNKKFSFFSQEEFNSFLIKETIRSNNFINR